MIHASRRRSDRRRLIQWGWAVVPVVAALAVGHLAAASTVEIIVLGDSESIQTLPDLGALAGEEAAQAFFRSSGASGALLYDRQGNLHRIYLVAPGGGEVHRFVSTGRTAEADEEDAEDERAFSEALRVAQDRSRPSFERQGAIARLARSGRREAVRVLEKVAAEDHRALRRAALAALGGLAHSPAAPAARDALESLEATDPQGPDVDRLRAQAAFEASPLIRAFRDAPNTLVKKNLVYSASHAADGPALTDFFLEALRDSSAVVRAVAALELIHMGDRVENALVTQALKDLAQHDSWRGVRKTALEALELRQAGGVPRIEPAPDLPDEVLRSRERGGGSAGGRRADNDAIVPGATNQNGF